jgi:hypothetical protein
MRFDFDGEGVAKTRVSVTVVSVTPSDVADHVSVLAFLDRISGVSFKTTVNREL